MRTILAKLLLSVAVVAVTATVSVLALTLPRAEGPLFCPTPTAVCRAAG